jgi:hypothetical protein
VAIDTFCAQETQALIHEGRVIDMDGEFDVTAVARAAKLKVASGTSTKGGLA